MTRWTLKQQVTQDHISSLDLGLKHKKIVQSHDQGCRHFTLSISFPITGCLGNRITKNNVRIKANIQLDVGQVQIHIICKYIYVFMYIYIYIYILYIYYTLLFQVDWLASSKSVYKQCSSWWILWIVVEDFLSYRSTQWFRLSCERFICCSFCTTGR